MPARSIASIPPFAAGNLARHSLLALMAGLAVGVLPGASQAQEPADSVRTPADSARAPADSSRASPAAAAHDAADVPADTVVHELERIVVTATRVPLPRAAVASAVSVITAEELDARGGVHALDALRGVAGASVVQTGGWGGPASLFLRGGENNYVQVLIDGVPVNRPGGDFDFSTLTTAGIERIEVVRGPASVLYGSSAVAGVVQLFTRRGEGPFRAYARMGGGTFGSRSWEAGANGGGDALGYSFALARFDTDGTLDLNNDYRNLTANGRLDFAPDERTHAALTLRWDDAEIHFPTDGAGRIRDANQFRSRDALTAGLQASRYLGEKVEVTVRLGAREVESSFDDRQDAASDTLGLFAFQSQGDLSRRSADAAVNLYLTGGAVLTAGFEVERQSERTTQGSRSEFGPSSSTSDVARTNRGYYAQALLPSVSDHLALTVGARIDDNDAFGTFFTWRGGASWRLAETTRLRATLGTAFKEPTFIENFASGFARGNPDLEPERSFAWDAGVEHGFAAGRVRLGATWFEQRFDDLIQFTFQPPEPGGPNYFNVQGASARGLELEATARATDWLELGGSWTWLTTEVSEAGFDAGPDANFVEGEALLRRPTHSASVRATLRPVGDASVAIEAAFVGDREDLDFSSFPARRITLPAYARVDLTARLPGWRPAAGRLLLQPTVRMDNVFDASYEEVTGFAARGRTLFVGARVEW